MAVTATFAQQAFAATLDIDFPLLSDWDRVVCESYGVRYSVWRGHAGLAKRSIFVIDRSGVIRYRWVTDLNPLTAVVDGFRWSMLGTAFPSAAATASSLVVVVVLVGTGVFAFRRTERTIVDLM